MSYKVETGQIFDPSPTSAIKPFVNPLLNQFPISLKICL